MPKSRTKTSTRHELVMDQLMEAAERLFTREGVAGTSLQQLAGEVGLTRTGVYRYMRGKVEMLEALVRGFTLDTARDLESLAEAGDRPAIERLTEGVTNMALKVAEHPARFRLLLTSEDAFPEPIAKQHRRARRRTLAALTGLISQAISEGSCRPIEPELAAFALAGVSNWVAFWYLRAHGAGAQSPEDVATALAEIVLGGLITEHATARPDGINDVIGLLREDLSRIEHMLDNR